MAKGKKQVKSKVEKSDIRAALAQTRHYHIPKHKGDSFAHISTQARKVLDELGFTFKEGYAPDIRDSAIKFLEDALNGHTS